MPYSFTEKKRIRKSFAKRPSVLSVPFLLATQLESYTHFLQADTPAQQAQDRGPAGGVLVDLPDLQPQRHGAARVRQLQPGRAAV